MSFVTCHVTSRGKLHIPLIFNERLLLQELKETVRMRKEEEKCITKQGEKVGNNQDNIEERKERGVDLSRKRGRNLRFRWCSRMVQNTAGSLSNSIRLEGAPSCTNI